MNISTREYTLLMNYRKLSDADKYRIEAIIETFIASIPCSRRRNLHTNNKVYTKERIKLFISMKSTAFNYKNY